MGLAVRPRSTAVADFRPIRRSADPPTGFTTERQAELSAEHLGADSGHPATKEFAEYLADSACQAAQERTKSGVMVPAECLAEGVAEPAAKYSS